MTKEVFQAVRTFLSKTRDFFNCRKDEQKGEYRV